MVKNLIVIKNSKSPFSALQESLRPHRKYHKAASTPKKGSFDGSGLIALIHHDLPIIDQLQLLKSIKNKWPNIAVIFVGNLLNSRDLILLFREGLADYLTEPIDIDELKAVTQRITCMRAMTIFDPSKYNLTDREFEVCKLLVEGFSGKKTAEILEITPATIKVHKARAMHKLGIKNLPDLVRMIGY